MGGDIYVILPSVYRRTTLSITWTECLSAGDPLYCKYQDGGVFARRAFRASLGDSGRVVQAFFRISGTPTTRDPQRPPSDSPDSFKRHESSGRSRSVAIGPRCPQMSPCVSRRPTKSSLGTVRSALVVPDSRGTTRPSGAQRHVVRRIGGHGSHDGSGMTLVGTAARCRSAYEVRTVIGAKLPKGGV
jgi:hypothetical protein